MSVEALAVMEVAEDRCWPPSSLSTELIDWLNARPQDDNRRTIAIQFNEAGVSLMAPILIFIPKRLSH